MFSGAQKNKIYGEKHYNISVVTFTRKKLPITNYSKYNSATIAQITTISPSISFLNFTSGFNKTSTLNSTSKNFAQMSPKKASLIGGIVGGIFALLLFILIIFILILCFLKRRRKGNTNPNSNNPVKSITDEQPAVIYNNDITTSNGQVNLYDNECTEKLPTDIYCLAQSFGGSNETNNMERQYPRTNENDNGGNVENEIEIKDIDADKYYLSNQTDDTVIFENIAYSAAK